MDPDFDDDNEDLSTLDRGDELEQKEAAPPAPTAEEEPIEGEETTEEISEEAAPASEQPRDEQGRFRRAENAEGEDGEPDDENLPIRLNKAKAQRDAERARADALEQRLKELENKAPVAAQDQQPDPVQALNEEVEGLYEQVEEARLDGDTKLAAKLQRQIDAKNRELVKLETVQVAQQASAHDRQVAQYNSMLDTLESRVSAMNPRSDDYDPALVQEMEFQVRAYESAGLSLPAALSRASALIFRSDVFNVSPAATPTEKPTKPAPKKPDIEKALDTARRQPPDISNAGSNTDAQKVDVSRMTDEEFDALPEATKRRLRGDDL